MARGIKRVSWVGKWPGEVQIQQSVRSRRQFPELVGQTGMTAEQCESEESAVLWEEGQTCGG